MSLISLLIVVLIFCLIFWAVQTLMAAFAVPQPIRTVVIVILVVIACLWLLSALGGISGGTGPIFRTR